MKIGGDFEAHGGHVGVGKGIEAELPPLFSLAESGEVFGEAVGARVVVVGEGLSDVGIHADEFAVDVKDWAARVAANEGAVGSEEISGSGRGDAPEADGWGAFGVEAFGMAEGDEPVAGVEGGGFSDGSAGEGLFFGDLDKGDVVVVIGAEDLSVKLLAVGEDDGDFLGALDDVGGGVDEAVGGDDDA